MIKHTMVTFTYIPSSITPVLIVLESSIFVIMISINDFFETVVLVGSSMFCIANLNSLLPPGFLKADVNLFFRPHRIMAATRFTTATTIRKTRIGC